MQLGIHPQEGTTSSTLRLPYLIFRAHISIQRIIRVSSHLIIDFLTCVDPSIVEPTTDTYLWNGWKSTTWSPAGLTSYGGCLLAVLTTNCDLFIVAPKVNFFIGKWLPTFDASARLREENAALLENSDPNEQLKGALRSQVLSIAWSTNPSTHQDVVAPSDMSILVTGTKSGELLIWKHLQHGQMDLVMCIDGHSKSWISLIALSDWRKQDNGCE